MRQDRDEPVRNFGARLRGQAGVCKYIIPCPSCTADVNYTDDILRDVVTRNISDSEVQLDLLGDSNQNMTLEEVLKFIEAKEAGKRSTSRLLHTQNVDAAHSSYVRTNPALSNPNLNIRTITAYIVVSKDMVSGHYPEFDRGNAQHMVNGNSLFDITEKYIVIAKYLIKYMIYVWRIHKEYIGCSLPCSHQGKC